MKKHNQSWFSDVLSDILQDIQSSVTSNTSKMLFDGRE